MNIQSLIAEVHARADANHDGKLSKADIESMADDHGIDKSTVDSLKQKADANGDGKLDPSDITPVLQQAGDMLGDLKNKVSGRL